MVSNERVIEAIENEEDICFEVCANEGQIFENVSNMAWFRIALKEALEDEDD